MKISILFCILALSLLAGCRDYSAEARIQADGAARVAQIEADASVTRTQLAEDGASLRNSATLATMPVLLAIVGGIGALWLVIWYRGRAHLVRVQTLAQLTTQASCPPPAQIAAAMPPQAVWIEAQRRRLLPVQEDGAWLLIDADGVPRLRMLPAPQE
jgi:hypothetical protein